MLTTRCQEDPLRFSVLEEPAGENIMNLVSVRIITTDVERLVSFYESISGVAATRYTPDFAELVTARGTVAVGSTQTLRAFHAEDQLQPETNRSIILEFLVKDVDADFVRLKEELTVVVQEPTTMPWGNRSLLFRDPDGNLVNFFTPVTPDAIKKFAR